MLRSQVARKVTQLATLTLGFVTFSYLSNVSLTQSGLNSIQLQSAQAADPYCGPSKDKAGKLATKFFLYPYMETFDPACQQHDACYDDLKTSRKTKEQCESEFRRNLYKLCEDRSLWQKVSQDVFGMITNPKLWGGIGMTGACKRQADYAYWAVSQFGEKVLKDANRAVYSVKVVDVKAKRIDDRWSDDELEVCVKVRNDSNLATEWDLVLLDKKGGIVDTEPDTYERNIKVGQTDQECVSTRGTTSSISDLGSQAKVVVRIDNTLGNAPFTPIAEIPVNTNRKKDKFTPVGFNQPSIMESYQQLKRIKSGR
ncbi:MAG: hypothetical protein IGR76_10405 [Synechococcales cyanobacterium T60_A2020_003]|nr:hypothetical protein [Synechococcales cyanobacterium T60_A2020_003]